VLTPSVSEIEGAFLMTRPRQPQDEIARLERRLARERRARLEAEAIAERGMRELYEKQRQILWLAITDELTGLFNRRYLFETMQKECQRAKRYRRDVSCLMLDVDGFKRYHDEHGHQAGDATLRHVASVITTLVRTVDVVSRYGGDEICILLPDTGAEGAISLAERMRATIEATPCPVDGTSLAVRVSIGIAWSTSAHESNPTMLLSRADASLRKAKLAGGNRVSSELAAAPV